MQNLLMFAYVQTVMQRDIDTECIYMPFFMVIIAEYHST